MAGVSVVIITKNEEKRIASCIDSVRWADEVIVVDGLSTDRTAAIAQEKGAQVIAHRFEDDFGLERNIGIDHSRGEWILQLDADEIVTEGLRQQIQNIASSAQTPYVAYKFIRKNIFLGHVMRYGGWRHYSLHFFKKGYARYNGRVHHILEVNGRTGTLQAEIEHRPFENITQVISRQNRYTTIEARELFEKHGAISTRIIRHNLTIKPFKIFWKIYVRKKGYKEGVYGIVFTIIDMMTHFLRWAKYWQILITKEEEATS
jgi:glycosyltransferase involved in cell wall biosynthesis